MVLESKEYGRRTASSSIAASLPVNGHSARRLPREEAQTHAAKNVIVARNTISAIGVTETTKSGSSVTFSTCPETAGFVPSDRFILQLRIGGASSQE